MGLLSTFLHICAFGLTAQQTYNYKVEVKAYDPGWQFTLSFLLSEQTEEVPGEPSKSTFASREVNLRSPTGVSTKNWAESPAIGALVSSDLSFVLTFLMPGGHTFRTTSFVHEFPKRLFLLSQEFIVDAYTEPPVQQGPRRWRMTQSFALRTSPDSSPIYWGRIDREYGPDGRPYFADVSLVNRFNSRVVIGIQRVPS